MTSHILHRQMKTPLPVIARSDGIYLFDSDGKKYLDGSGGAAVSCLGHGHPRVTEAIKNQIDKIAFAHTGFFTNEPAEELAAWLCERAPGAFGRVVFAAGGSEAVEAALKIARQVHVERGEAQRYHFIARRQSYHGATLGAMSAGY
ncbi:MAG: aminotransferase class III-fold pyridoxal phosphate-dependent enzyme, partial [Hyphomicrobiales bacterium]|nr:aminotransferase class III-fold pyridoxal phosphate-dependent enzyme [Hyphomicrobiales bacterium]